MNTSGGQRPDENIPGKPEAHASAVDGAAIDGERAEDEAGPKDEAPGRPSPRAFCHATGHIYQAIGFFLSIVMCCWWPSNCWQDPIATTRPSDIDRASMWSAPAEDLWAMASVVLAFAGGLGLIVMGFGLQQDRLRTARAPMALTAVVGLFYWLYLGFSIFAFPAVGRILVSAIFALVWTACFLLAGVSNDQLRAHPPTRSEQSWTSRDEDDFRNTLSPGSRDKTNP